MQLTYDFDMFNIVPESVQSEYQKQFNALKLTPLMSQQIALFRDERTAAALKSADKTVQQFFLDAGFGMNVYSSGAPAGRFVERDEMERLRRFDKLLMLSMERRDELRAANWGKFSYGDFLKYNQAATPISERDLNALHAAVLKQRRRGRAGTKLGLVLGLGLIAFSASHLIN